MIIMNHIKIKSYKSKNQGQKVFVLCSLSIPPTSVLLHTFTLSLELLDSILRHVMSVEKKYNNHNNIKKHEGHPLVDLISR